jgi:hypothetical protein
VCIARGRAEKLSELSWIAIPHIYSVQNCKRRHCVMEKSQIYTTIDTSILIEVMLNELNREGYINNETYLSAKSELKKESDINVDIIRVH